MAQFDRTLLVAGVKYSDALVQITGFRKLNIVTVLAKDEINVPIALSAFRDKQPGWLFGLAYIPVIPGELLECLWLIGSNKSS